MMYLKQSSALTAVIYILLLLILVLIGCTPGVLRPSSGVIRTSPDEPGLAEEIVFYDWENDIPQEVLDAFSREFKVRVEYRTYQKQEAVFDEIVNGAVYDVVVLDNDALPQYIENDLLAAIDYANVPNFKNIMANFRDLIYDPGNEHSIPYSYGTIGLVVRADLVQQIPCHWADLWDPQYAGQIGVRKDVPYDLIGAVLKSLGYSINSEEAAELAEVEQKLADLRPNVQLVGSTAEEAIPLMLDGSITVLVGWSEDVWYGSEINPSITYVLPQEGTLLWVDSYVIPANSPNKYTAEVFINFLLRPEISAQITNHNYYATANEAAISLIDEDIRSSPLVFPTTEALKNAEVFFPHTANGELQYQLIWERFLSSDPNDQ